jgi:hypothetical protein
MDTRRPGFNILNTLIYSVCCNDDACYYSIYLSYNDIRTKLNTYCVVWGFSILCFFSVAVNTHIPRQLNGKQR